MLNDKTKYGIFVEAIPKEPTKNIKIIRDDDNLNGNFIMENYNAKYNFNESNLLNKRFRSLRIWDSNDQENFSEYTDCKINSIDNNKSQIILSISGKKI